MRSIVMIAALSLAGLLWAWAGSYEGDNLEDTWKLTHGLSTNVIAPESLVGWWQLNASNGLSAEDRSGNLLPLQLSAPDGAAVPSSASGTGGTVWQPGLFNNGAQLDGAYYLAAQVNSGAGPTVYGLGGDFTFSCWVKTPATQDEQVIARWLDSSGNGWQLDTATNGQLRARFSTPSGSAQIVQQSSVQRLIKDGAWHQAALVYKAANGEASLYLDGKLEATKIVSGTFGPSVAEFRIGDKGWGVPFKGQIDEVRLYKAALTQAEVASLPATYYDMDGDGLNSLQEMGLSAHPGLRDSDNDGIPDGAEAVLGLNATNAADASQVAASGLTRLAEYRAGLDAGNATAGGAVDPAHVIGYWPFELNGTNAAPQLADAMYVFDHSSSALAGELRGIPAASRAQAFGPGKVRNGVVLSGNGAHVEVRPSSTSPLTLPTGDYSVSAWVKTTDTSSSNAIFQFLDADGLGWELGVVNTGAVRARIDTSAATQGQVDQVVRNWSGSAKLIQDGQWHNVTLTFIASTRTAVIYVDGVEDASRQISGTHGLTPKSLKIGSGWNASWRGSIDEVRIWNVTLSSTQVVSLYQTTIAAFGPGDSPTGGTTPGGGSTGGGSGTGTGGTTYVPGEPQVGENLAAVVRHRPYINGKLSGSLQMLLAEDVSLNNGVAITGDLLVPGVPQLTQNGQNTFGGIKTGTGAATPTQFRVTLNGGATLRYLTTRIDPITMPTAEQPANPTGNRSVSLNSATDVPGDWVGSSRVDLQACKLEYSIVSPK